MVTQSLLHRCEAGAAVNIGEVVHECGTRLGNAEGVFTRERRNLAATKEGKRLSVRGTAAILFAQARSSPDQREAGVAVQGEWISSDGGEQANCIFNDGARECRKSSHQTLGKRLEVALWVSGVLGTTGAIVRGESRLGARVGLLLDGSC